jgi:glutamate-1-semialdehyde 2,1-aminomutase
MAYAATLMPGGVNSPVRGFQAVGGDPPVIAEGSGARVRDEDGVEYLDFVLGYGPQILGHGDPAVAGALRAQLERGTAFGSPTRLEAELAQRVVDAVPSIELVRMVNSGTEATMSAIRLARAATGRTGVLKFAGGYHGHADHLLAGAGSGVETLGIPSTAGVPAAAVADTVTVPYNDIAAVEDLLTATPDRFAAVIVEPVAGNMGCVPPIPGFLEGLRRACSAAGSLLIFDEVMTGFRVAYGGAQARFGVTPDLTCLGKVLGGGLPIGAYGGHADLMCEVAPAGPVYQAGTMSGGPLAMAAGIATLDRLRDGDAYARLESLGGALADGLAQASAEAGVPCAVNRVGSMLTIFPGVEAVRDLEDARSVAREDFATLHAAWLDAGILWPPSQFESAFLSTAHTLEDVRRVCAVTAQALRSPAKVVV